MNTVENLETLKVAALDGDLTAKTALAKHMIAMPTSLKSFEEGQILLKEAFTLGCGEAAEFMAVMHAAGIGVEQNWNLALDYLSQAALLGWNRASEQLSILADQKDADGTWNVNQADVKSTRRQISLETLFRIPEKQILSQAPRIRKCERFLAHRFCDWMISRARPKLGRARTYDAVAVNGRESHERTNSSASFGVLELDLILLLIQTRISMISEMPMFVMENASVLHYDLGQQFRPHYDYLDPNKPTHAADMRRLGQRLITCLIYLNDDFDGAETSFPKLGQRFRCDKGGALLFANIDEQGQPDPKTLHAGLSPTRGEKWLFSQWIRSGPLPPKS